MAAPAGIQGQTLEITVVGCNKLRDTEWISRQDPYVCLEYASSKFRTHTSKDGGKNPTFNEKFVLTLIEGLREIDMKVWNSNTVSRDDFIGSGKVQLNKVLSEGFDDTAWSLGGRRGRYTGEVKLLMHYAGAKKQEHPAAPSPYPASAYGPPPPHYMPSHPPTSSPYGQQAIPGYPPSSCPPASHYPPPASHYPPPTSHYPPPANSYPPPANSYPPPANSYPPPPTAPPQPGAYAYPPPPHTYPPAHPGVYPPPSY